MDAPEHDPRLDAALERPSPECRYRATATPVGRSRPGSPRRPSVRVHLGILARRLRRAQIALTPGRDFGPALASRFLRLSFASSDEDLDEAVRRLATLLPTLRRE